MKKGIFNIKVRCLEYIDVVDEEKLATLMEANEEVQIPPVKQQEQIKVCDDTYNIYLLDETNNVYGVSPLKLIRTNQETKEDIGSIDYTETPLPLQIYVTSNVDSIISEVVNNRYMDTMEAADISWVEELKES